LDFQALFYFRKALFTFYGRKIDFPHNTGIGFFFLWRDYMGCSEIINHKGKNVFLVNLANCSPQTTFSVLDEAAAMIALSEPKSALILTDSTGATYNSEVSNAMKNFSGKNTPYVKGSAVIGADAMRKVLVAAIRLATKRDIRTFDSREEALDWLVSL
jgi:hypothetical protein